MRVIKKLWLNHKWLRVSNNITISPNNLQTTTIYPSRKMKGWSTCKVSKVTIKKYEIAEPLQKASTEGPNAIKHHDIISISYSRQTLSLSTYYNRILQTSKPPKTHGKVYLIVQNIQKPLVFFWGLQPQGLKSSVLRGFKTSCFLHQNLKAFPLQALSTTSSLCGTTRISSTRSSQNIARWRRAGKRGRSRWKWKAKQMFYFIFLMWVVSVFFMWLLKWYFLFAWCFLVRLNGFWTIATVWR